LNKKLSRVSKKFSIGNGQKSKKGGVSSPSQVKKQTYSNPTPVLQIKPSTPPQSKISALIPDSKAETGSNMNTLTRDEINDLNDLLSMFGDKEHMDPSLGIETTDHPSSKANNQQVKSVKNLSQPPPYLETRTLGRKPKPPYQTQTPVETTLQRSQSQIYSKRIEPDPKEYYEQPQQQLGRSQTLTRPARRAYTRSLDRERAKNGKNTFLFQNENSKNNILTLFAKFRFVTGLVYWSINTITASSILLEVNET